MLTLQNEYMKDDFLIKIETWHKPDLGTQDNVSGLFIIISIAMGLIPVIMHFQPLWTVEAQHQFLDHVHVNLSISIL